MNKIRAIIIDDEPLAREVIKAYLKNAEDIVIVSECGDGFDGLKQIRELKPDLVFLDVQMPKINGFEILEVIDEPVNIIFSTAFDQYAIKAFENNAVDYLLKPYSKERFLDAIHKLRTRLSTKSTLKQDINQVSENYLSDQVLSRIIVKNGAKVKVILIDEVIYFEAQDDFVAIHTKEGKFLKQKTMKFFEEHLPSDKFLRIHRSYIVNLDEVQHLESYEKETYRVTLKNKEQLPVSRSGYSRLRERFEV